ncbi:MAG TPA: threonine aldolase family protein [Limnochordia bacterium]|nr:threonine aldolase family protein [Limnochordia bacterium]
MRTYRVDLISDTVTKPSAAMRKAMAEAEVGDEQKFEDPTVNRLQERVCELLGKEAALYLPSGTMCNQIALAVHCRAGDAVFMDQTAHPLTAEGGGPAANARAMVVPIAGEGGVFTAEQLAAALPDGSRYRPVARLVSLEQTSNLGGGRIWPLATLDGVCRLARARGLALHLDGARLFNAVVGGGVPAREYAARVDSIWIDFSKGLGAPVGACLAGSAAFIAEAWRWKQRLGGSMRQAGIIAAGALYALEHNVERLADDHRRAARLAAQVADLPGLHAHPVETNIVLIDVERPAALWAERLAAHDVRVGAIGPNRLRAVTHLDVDDAAIEQAVAAFRTTAETLAAEPAAGTR